MAAELPEPHHEREDVRVVLHEHAALLIPQDNVHRLLLKDCVTKLLILRERNLPNDHGLCRQGDNRVTVWLLVVFGSSKTDGVHEGLEALEPALLAVLAGTFDLIFEIPEAAGVEVKLEPVHERPELCQVILYRSSGDHPPALAVQQVSSFGSLGIVVFDEMTFVENDAEPGSTEKWTSVGIELVR